MKYVANLVVLFFMKIIGTLWSNKINSIF